MKNESVISPRWWLVLRLQLLRWWQLHEQRQRLAALDETALKDMGLSRADVLAESERPFWDDPLGPPQYVRKRPSRFDARHSSPQCR